MRTIELLDHGYVKLVETWGSDERIIEAARMSTDKGFQGWGHLRCSHCGTEWVPTTKEQWSKVPAPSIYRGGETEGHYSRGTGGGCKYCDGNLEGESEWVTGDEKLLRFLYENNHATPFEMAGMIIEVQAPIFVFREWHRHRTQCLAPDTLVHFESPKGKKNGRRYVYKMRIEDIWKKWQPTVRSSRPERQKNPLFPRSRIQGMILRCLDEKSGEFIETSVVDVIKGEPKPMVKVTTASGRQVTATKDHKVFTEGGWMTLGDAIRDRALLALEGTARNKADRWEIPEVDTESARALASGDW